MSNMSIAELLCEPKLEIEIYEKEEFCGFHEFVYRQIDIVGLIASINAVMMRQEWLVDDEEGYLPVTTRQYSEPFLSGVKINDIKNGSLFLSIVSGVAVGIILMVIEATYKKRHPEQNEPKVTINNHYENCIIEIDGNQIKSIPKGSVLRDSIYNVEGNGCARLDVKKYTEGMIDNIDPSDNLEDNIHRCLQKMAKEGIIDNSPVYNSKGERTVCNYAGRMLDFRV